MSDRPGGTGANVARAVASRGVAVAMVGYVGCDRWGELSRANLDEWGVDTSQVDTIDGDTSQVLLLIEPTGERTIVGVVPDHMSTVRLDLEAVHPEDLVYLAAWWTEFTPMVVDLAARRALVASVPFTGGSEPLPVSFVIGSMAEVPPEARESPWEVYRQWTGGRLEAVILSLGSEGAMSIDANGAQHFGAHAVEAVDATGAGDAFAAAIVTAMVEGRHPSSGIDEGMLWGAAAVGIEASIPPPWSEVQQIRTASSPSIARPSPDS